MDTILISVTALSLAAAAGMGVLLMRTLRRERRRSDARVELLEQLATNGPEAGIERPPARRRAPVLDDFELRPAVAPASATAGAAAVSEIFEEHHAPPAWPRRFAIIGAMAAIVCAVFFGWRELGSSASSEIEAPRQAQGAGAVQPLELLSLQHAQQDGTLVISGLVQNPRGSAPLANVQATAVLFGADGATLTSTRAPLDFTTLGPGDESAFVIRIPAATAVARYRVGFRSGDDGVLNHVDRRNTETVARKQAP